MDNLTVMTVREAAASVGVSPATIRRWCHAGLPTVSVNRVRRVLAADLVAFLDAHRSGMAT